MKQSTIFLLCLVLCSTMLTGGAAAQLTNTIDASAIDPEDLVSYEGENVSSIELAGRPDLPEGSDSLILQRAGEPFSQAKVMQTVAALKGVVAEDVQIEVRPETEGVRVLFVLQPAVYFGIYDFDQPGPFSHSRLLQVTNYSSPAPYSPVDVLRAEAALETFFQRNGYFQSEVRSETQTDPAHGLANVLFRIELNRLAKFGDVHIIGTTPEEAEELGSSLRSLRARLHTAAVRPGKKYSLKTLQDATQYLEDRLTKRNHLAAQVRLIGAEYNPETNRADVTFNIQTGPPVTVKVEGAHLWNGTKRKLLPIYQQIGLSPELIQEGRQNLLTHFRSKGHFDVQVDADQQQLPSGEVILYRIEKGDRKKIEEITFTGNEHMSEEELLQHVSVEKAHLFTHGKYDEASLKSLESFYVAAGFNQVKVSSQLTTHDGHMDVKFNIEEGPQDIVESLSVQVNEPWSQEFIAREGLRLAQGQPYSQKLVDDDRNKIISHYLDLGYLSAVFRETAEPVPGNPHRFRVVYSISEGPQVVAANLVIIGQKHTKTQLIARDTAALKTGEPLTERQLLTSESVLYTRGIFDWAEVDPRRQITSQTQEDVIVKVHEAKRNSVVYGIGFERVNRGGSVPAGTVAVPGLPPIGLPDTFKVSEHAYKGPRASIQYTRSNFRGKAETISLGGVAGPLIRRASFVYSNPVFRWTNWGSNFTVTGERNKENPIFTTRQAQVGWQLQRTLDRNKTKSLFLRYSFTALGMYDLVIPELVASEDLHTRLSTFSVNLVRDTRDNVLDAHTGNYQSAQLDLNSRLLGSNVSFAKLLLQTAYYREIRPGTIWANSIRIGLEQAFAGSHVPLSERFFTGGGSTLRGFPLNGAGPQNTIPACSDPADPNSCSKIRVPAGGTQLLVINSEFRIPVPFKKNLSFVTFYDGGNVFHPIGFHDFRVNYTNTIGIGARYATPVGPLRIDIGRNLNRIEGISATQIFITLGQAF